MCCQGLSVTISSFCWAIILRHVQVIHWWTRHQRSPRSGRLRIPLDQPQLRALNRLIVRSGSSSIFTAAQIRLCITNLEAQFVIGSGSRHRWNIHDVTSIDLTTLTTTNYSVNFYDRPVPGTNGADTLQGYAAAPVEFYGGAWSRHPGLKFRQQPILTS